MCATQETANTPSARFDLSTGKTVTGSSQDPLAQSFCASPCPCCYFPRTHSGLANLAAVAVNPFAGKVPYRAAAGIDQIGENVSASPFVNPAGTCLVCFSFFCSGILFFWSLTGLPLSQTTSFKATAPRRASRPSLRAGVRRRAPRPASPSRRAAFRPTFSARVFGFLPFEYSLSSSGTGRCGVR